MEGFFDWIYEINRIFQLERAGVQKEFSTLLQNAETRSSESFAELWPKMECGSGLPAGCDFVNIYFSFLGASQRLLRLCVLKNLA